MNFLGSYAYFAKLLESNQIRISHKQEESDGCRFFCNMGIEIFLSQQGEIQVRGEDALKLEMEQQLALIFDVDITDLAMDGQGNLSKRQLFVITQGQAEGQQLIQLLKNFGVAERLINWRCYDQSENLPSLLEVLNSQETGKTHCLVIVLLSASSANKQMGISDYAPQFMFELGLLLGRLEQGQVAILKTPQLPAPVTQLTYLNFDQILPQSLLPQLASWRSL